jgi:hypothetical protein
LRKGVDGVESFFSALGMETPRYDYATMHSWCLIEIAIARDLPAEPNADWEMDPQNLCADDRALLAEIDKRGLRK